jgi:hypothetical protein
MKRIGSFLIISCLAVFSCKSTVDEKKQTDSVFTAILSSSTSSATLDSWADAPRKRIESYVIEVTDAASPKFIPITDRIAVFDNDGTLWPEQPIPTQAIFAIDNLKAISDSHPEFQKAPVLKGVLNNDIVPMKKEGVKGLLKLLSASHNGQSAETFNLAVQNWIDTTIDTKFNKLYKEVIYQPMLELLVYLRANEFKSFIVSGGGADFMRVWSNEVYGIPPLTRL